MTFLKPHFLQTAKRSLKQLIYISAYMISAYMVLSALMGCAKTPYIAKPIEPAKVQQQITEKSALSPAFMAFCQRQGYQKNLPFINWGLEELTLSALYFHPKLNVAKAQLGVAKAAIETAGQTTSPTLGAQVARSNRANGDIRPFSYGFNVEIPIETNNKRQLRIEEAQQLAEAARLDVAETAWQLHAQLAQDLQQIQTLNAKISLQQNLLKAQEKLHQHIEKRLKSGIANSSELAASRAQLTKTQSLLTQEKAKTANLHTQLAHNAGLSLEAWLKIPLQLSAFETDFEPNLAWLSAANNLDALQAQALLNRIDIRRGLVKYGAAETKIKQEVAKQTPDISLSPGYVFEFGDKIWSLGFSSLLNLLKKMPTQIHEAEALRAVEGAQFELLQTQTMQAVESAKSELLALLNGFETAKNNRAADAVVLEKTQKLFVAGQIDQLELLQAELAAQLSNTELLNAKIALMQHKLNIESLLQRDLMPEMVIKKTANEKALTHE